MASKSNTQEFIQKAVIKYSSHYDYSLVDYKNKSTKIKIICPVHGVFEQRPNNHLNGCGCKLCGNSLTNRGRELTTTQFITKAKQIHGLQYNYSLTEYKHNQQKITITCKVHGSFAQTPTHHLQGMGCPKCSNNTKKDLEQFITEASKLHNNLYSYSKFVYINNKTKGIIICKKHGEFLQTPNYHLSLKYGCPKCKHITSKGEKEVAEFIRSLEIKVIENTKDLISPLTVDIYLPDFNLAVEYNGLIHHSELRKDRNYHWNKSKACLKKGVRLIHVWEDDWINKQNIVKSVLINALGKNTFKNYARKCQITKISNKEANAIYLNNHLLGSCSTSVKEHYALTKDDQILSVMSFAKGASLRGNSDDWELLRFVNLGNVVGAANKLFQVFIKEHEPNKVISFSDNDYFDGKIYEVLGFGLDEELRSDYKTIWKNQRKHKTYTKKINLAKLFPDCNLKKTEHEICLENNVYRVYDSGKKRWIWSKLLT